MSGGSGTQGHVDQPTSVLTATFAGGGEVGIYDDSVVRFDGNTLTGGPHLYVQSRAAAHEVTNNVIEGTLAYAINSHGDLTVISGNRISDPGEAGIRIRNGSATVAGNRVSGAQSGIRAAGGTADIVGNILVGNDVGINGMEIPVVQGNTVRDGLAGIQVSGGDVVIDGNVVEGNSGSGLSLGAATTATLTDNVICGNGENLTLIGDAEPQIDDSNEICEDAPAE